jgi:hypothetical protein
MASIQFAELIGTELIGRSPRMQAVNGPPKKQSNDHVEWQAFSSLN